MAYHSTRILFHRSPRSHGLGLVCCLTLLLLVLPGAVTGAGRDRIEAFLNVTGFDVALDSIALSAGSAPDMLGVDENRFGSDWGRLADEVFDTAAMHEMALEILEQTLTDEALTHAVDFYASDLGQRLVEVENQTHMNEDETGELGGQKLVADMVASGDPRLEMFKRMNTAIDASGSSLRAIQEIQFRFLMAAASAGVVELRMDPDDLRMMFKAQEPELLPILRRSALAGAAYTYRSFSDDDLAAYVEALEKPEMIQVYELLNAVQYEIMANRFEVLAGRMTELHPGQDI